MSLSVRTRWIGGAALVVACAGLWLVSHKHHLAAVAAAKAATPRGPISQECIDAIQTLKTLTKPSDKEARGKVFDIVAAKGDYRLTPVMAAYKLELLILRDGRFLTLGEGTPMQVDGQKQMMKPLVDLLTHETFKDAEGKPVYVRRYGDAGAKATGAPFIPLRKINERPDVEELLSVMRLSDPDPQVRITATRDVAERAGRAYIDVSEQERFRVALRTTREALTTEPIPDDVKALVPPAITAIDAALAEKPGKPIEAIPRRGPATAAIDAITRIALIINPPTDSDDSSGPATKPASGAVTAASQPTTNPTAAQPTPESPLGLALVGFSHVAKDYLDHLDSQTNELTKLPKYVLALKGQIEKATPDDPFIETLREAIACTDAVFGDHPAQIKAAQILGDVGTGRAVNILQRMVDSARQAGDTDLEKAATPALSKAQGRQTRVQFVQNTFFGLSAGSILVLLALGLSIIFGLMGVINMAHGEFMMLGAFTTYMVSEGFKRFAPGYFNYYLIAAIPAAFFVAGMAGFVLEYLVIRHLYGRPRETLLATFGIGLILIWLVRNFFGDNISVTPPKWMEGDIEIVPDLNFQLNRIYIIVYCMICIAVLYFIVNRTKLGLLLRATTQNREMAAALGVATRRIDGITFAIGAGLAGFAGVAVPLYNKINPQIGQEYIVDSFMVVVVGGVGKLAGATWAGLGLGFIGKYLEPILQNIKSLASGASVIGRVVVLGMIVVFLQFRPSGLFPPKGRQADV